MGRIRDNRLHFDFIINQIMDEYINAGMMILIGVLVTIILKQAWEVIKETRENKN